MTARFQLSDLSIDEGSLVDAGDNPEAHIKLFKMKSGDSEEEPTEKATWTTAYVNDLPDSSFLHVEGGGKKDAGGKTTPRSLRHFPVKDADGKVDLPHLRNALARIPQSKLPQGAKDKAAGKAKAMLEETRKEYAMPMNGGALYPIAPRTTAEIIAEREFRDEFCELKWAYQDSISSILSGVEPGQMGGFLAKTTAEFSDAVGVLIDSIAKASPGLAAHALEVVESLKQACTAEPAAIRGEITKAAAALDSLTPNRKTTEENVSQKNSTPAPKTVDEILAALPEADRAAVKTQLEEAAKAKEDADKAKAEAEKVATAKADAEKADLAKRVSDAEATIAKMKDEKLTVEFTAKAREIGAGDVNEVATLLKAAYGRDQKEGETLERTLRAMAEQIKKSNVLLRVVGSEATGGADSPEGQLEAKAKAIATAENVSFHVGYSRAMERNPDLAKNAVRKAAAASE
jgi:hypothetical protein